MNREEMNEVSERKDWAHLNRKRGQWGIQLLEKIGILIKVLIRNLLHKIHFDKFCLNFLQTGLAQSISQDVTFGRGS